jgi:alkylation response protein AidB-like acyl-CoA dehydrogenase
MALILTEEQTMLRDSARSFLADNAPVLQLRSLRDRRDETGFSRALWTQFAEMGFTGVLVPEAHGGLGLGLVEAAVVMEEIGRHLSVSPFLASSVVAVTAIGHAGTAAQQAEWLPAIASGECIATLAVDEHGKHCPQGIALKATKSGDGYRLDGHKTFVLDGQAADLLIVAARTGGGISLFTVRRDTPGLTIESVVAVDAHRTARLTFNGVTVPARAVLGALDGGAAALEIALDAGRAAAAAELVGIAGETFDRTIAYLKERRQFDKVIGEFQGLQHRAAMLYCDIELARSAVAKALESLDADPVKAATAVSVAKARAGKSATLAVQEGVQMHGGMGMTDQFEIGFFMKRARVLQELFGDTNFHADRMARARGY